MVGIIPEISPVDAEKEAAYEITHLDTAHKQLLVLQRVISAAET